MSDELGLHAPPARADRPASANFHMLSRADLAQQPMRLLAHGRNCTKADVFLTEVNGQRLVIKDLHGRSRLVRWLFGRLLLRREYTILAGLTGLPGVPRVYQMVDADAFVMEYISGTDIGTLGRVSGATMGQLTRLFIGLHARGVVHGDPHGRNILVTAQGEPVLIDFSTALRRPGARAFCSRSRSWLWRQLEQQDWRRVARLKQRFSPELLTSEERRLLTTPSRVYRLTKSVRRLVQWLILHQWRRQRRAHNRLNPPAV